MACMLALLIGGVAGARADSAQYYYDPAGRLTAMVDPVNGSAQYSYDAVGNILSVVRRQITDLMVAELSPSRGVAGTVVTIFGTGFGTTSDTTVSFNGQAATPIAVSATQITVAVPDGATSGPVSVTAPGGTLLSATSFTATSALVPSISGVSPSSANQGAIITISGSGFDPVLSHDKVLINGRSATVVSAASSAITALVPAATSGYVSVITPNGTATSGNYLVVPPLPYPASSIGSVVQSSIGSSATTNVTTAGQIGLILFDATAGQRVALQVTASSLGSGIIQLYGPDGTPIGSSAAVSNGSFIGNNLLPQNGTYTVVVATGSTTTGAITLNLIDAPDVSGTITTNGTPVSLTTTAPGQNMVLTFSGIAGQRISLVTQATSGSIANTCSSFSILQPDRTSIVYSGGACSGLYSGVVILPVSGSYSIVLNAGGSTFGTETFTLYDVPPDVSGTIATDGTPVSLTTTAPGQNMSLTFTGTAGQRISLIAQATSGSITNTCSGVLILQPDGTSSVYSGGACSGLYSGVVTLPVAGIYSIAVNVGGSTSGTETLTLYNVPPDVSGTIATDGTPVSLTTTTPGQNMSLTFTGTAGQRISLITQATSGSIANTCSGFSILQPDGTSSVYSGGACSGLYSGVVILPVAGIYTIAVQVGGSTTGTETLTLYNLPPDASATITPGGGSVSLTTTVPGQDMSLIFTATAGQRVSLLAQATSGSIGNTCSGFLILQPDGTSSVYSGSGCPGLYSDVVILPVAGTYTIKVNPGGSVTGMETFTLYDVPPDVTGTTSVGQSAADYTTTAPGQAIQVSFAGTSGQSVTVLVAAVNTTPSTPCYKITTLASDGITVVRGDQSCSAGYSSGSLSLPQNGSYTVIVHPINLATGTFSVGVNAP